VGARCGPLWRIYERGLIADEYAKVKLLSVSIFPNVNLHFRTARSERSRT
jgi:hypothetical protein